MRQLSHAIGPLGRHLSQRAARTGPGRAGPDRDAPRYVDKR